METFKRNIYMVETREEIKHQIITAAFNRFAQYGFNKTTMAEIAQDCQMSAGNLYRYFTSKTDIGAEIAATHFDEMEKLLREIINRPNMSAASLIEAFIVEILHILFDCFSNQPKITELIEFVHEERKELIEKHINTTRSLLAEILALGNKTGEFDVPDIVSTAGIIHVATVKFNCPYFIVTGCFSLEELELLAKGVVNLLVQGLKKR